MTVSPDRQPHNGTALPVSDAVVAVYSTEGNLTTAIKHLEGERYDMSRISTLGHPTVCWCTSTRQALHYLQEPPVNAATRPRRSDPPAPRGLGGRRLGRSRLAVDPHVRGERHSHRAAGQRSGSGGAEVLTA